MKATLWLGAAAVGILGSAAALPSAALAQRTPMTQSAPNAPTLIVSIYHVAPGKHLDFLRYMARTDAIAKEAGIGPTQWYAHLDGDSWDYVTIAPATTAEQDRRVDAIGRRRGVPGGFAGGIQFRQFITSHTDTYVRGPTTAADLVAAGSQR